MAASWSTQSAAGQAMKVGSGSRLWENVRTHCQDATTESKTQSRRIFDTRAACCLNQSCAQIAHKMVFAQPRAAAPRRRGAARATASGSNLESARLPPQAARPASARGRRRANLPMALSASIGTPTPLSIAQLVKHKYEIHSIVLKYLTKGHHITSFSDSG